MKCDRAIRTLLHLDHFDHPDKRTAAHLSRCPRCRAEFDRLKRTIAILSDPGDVPIDDQLSERIMTSVRARSIVGTHYPAWIGSGILIMTGLVTLPYNPVMGYLARISGSSIDLTLALILGFGITTYLSIFIATHVHDLSRMLGRDTST